MNSNYLFIFFQNPTVERVDIIKKYMQFMD